MAGLLSRVSEQGGGEMLTAGTSEDGASQGAWRAEPGRRRHGPKPFGCELCGKAFAMRTSLFHHMSLHRGETACPVCQRVFSRKSNMRGHMKTMHVWRLFPAPAVAVPPVRDHLCRLCGKTFKYDTSLMHHMKVHRGETTCRVCGKVLSRTGQLHSHMLTQHPELVQPPPPPPLP
ncbi:gastrula zinc finger protein XlCGF26.1-like [Pollicipes pollicipes]|uniref:gastrula zinc finger protein XlCGF26.1-like n=1 Tax=Pollicipes pollicipes TaxID=41117 RepID=UPI001884D3FE|nr:gastrula zinc finger protein XlCGF26.1-like [Pollicipes pollicipes]